MSRYFDRINRPEQLIPALQRAMNVLTDPAECGPVTLAMCQDVQTEAYDWPESLFAEKVWAPRRIRPDENELAAAIAAIKAAKRPMIIAGGGVLYSEASAELTAFAETHGVPVAVSQAGKSSIDENHPLALGAVGVTGTSAANALAADADLVLAVGTRLQDFTTGSWALFKSGDLKIVALNVAPYDTAKHDAQPLVCDAKVGLTELSEGLAGWKADRGVAQRAAKEKAIWLEAAGRALASTNAEKPSDAQVIGAIARTLGAENTVIVNAAGGLPGELHKLWVPTAPGAYHMEYGFSCMGYEIAGGIGVKMARPDKEVVVMVGDGSYMMLNSELATSVSLGLKLDRRGARQPWLRLHQPPADGDGRGQLQQSLAGLRHGRAAGHRLPQTCREHGRDRDEGVVDRRSRGRAGGGQGERPHHGDRHRDPSADRHRSGRALVGRRGPRGVVARRSGRGSRKIRDRPPASADVQLSETRSLGDPVKPVARKRRRKESQCPNCA